MTNTTQLFARICSVTGRGMWDGWVFGDGEQYACDEMSANKIANELGYKDIEEAYEDDACYYTDWQDCDPEYIEINGVFYDYAGEDANPEIYGTEYYPVLKSHPVRP